MGDTPEYYFQQNARDQEANLVAWTLRQESLGYTPSQSQIRACVVAVLKQQGCDSRLGRHWVEKFIQRHPELRSKVVHWYFDVREKEYGWIKPENTVNVDEGGIMSGFGLDSLVVGSSDPKRKTLLKGPQSRSWTTFIEAITADQGGKPLNQLNQRVKLSRLTAYISEPLVELSNPSPR
ncbi:tc5 transposase DNA-binding domain-containing protein [Hirsutella rhossiliensis]|uniref:Tc5 transposase DNA-binding domain-containing protein n=1 Tax=Hirsutella rhossiliensis TaxID=111463 RepID=A0A9P8N3H3_9HYPO|nr:tc5 transposase DNA-binding domain-containing protein [Hirsutella rhossiliensis]KAH0966210.1 tc5 transposase DNA-binding domain-containing protein [Hirsutella rhossiliensis]